MSDDFVLNVRQVGQYPLTLSVGPNDVTLIQKGGLGGPYNSMLPTDLVSTAMLDGGFINFTVNGGIVWNVNGVPQTAITSDGVNIVANANLNVPSLRSVGDIFVNGEAVATQTNVTQLIDALFVDSVRSFNGRQGIVQLNEQDILRAGGILQNNPHFTGTVLVPTVWDFRSNDEHAASTAWVQGVLGALLCSGSVVTSFNGRGGDVWLTADDITFAATQTGAMPRAVTPPLGDASTRIATTQFVDDTVYDVYDKLVILINNQTDAALINYAPLHSPAFTGIPTAPTAPPGSTTGQLATTAFVMNAVAAATAGVSSFNTRTGAVTLVTADITAAGGAPINAPTFTGIPQAPTAANATNTQQLATTAFVHNLLTATGMVTSFNTRTGAVVLSSADITGAGGAPSASPALTGTPTAPTAVAGTNTTQLATTAFVQAALGTVTGAVSSWNGRTGAVTLQANDVSAVGGALLASPSFTGVPLAPTAAVGTNTTQIATTAFVMANAGVGGVSSFNGRTGAITLLTGDVTAAGGAPISSPSFTGTPTAPTPAQTVNDQTLATTAYVKTALAAATGVASFNTRTGVVTLLPADITGAGGALTTGPTFTGVPSAPTASPGTNTTQLATTAFVMAAVGAAVTSFNGRTGAITFIANDITSAGGALLASPTFSGTPNAPTPTTGTNNTQIATTAFVNAAITAAGGVVFKQQDTAPAVGTNLWFNSLTGQLYVGYVDPVSSAFSWVIANSMVNPPPPTPTTGSRVLITRQTISSPVATVDFPNVFTATYIDYEVVITGMKQSGTVGVPWFLFSKTGGTSWLQTAFYSFAQNWMTSGSGTPGGANGSGVTAGTIGQQFDNTGANGTDIVSRFFHPRSTTQMKTFTNSGIAENNVNGIISFTTAGGWFVAADVIDSIRFLMSSGNNLVAGTISIFGIVP